MAVRCLNCLLCSLMAVRLSSKVLHLSCLHLDTSLDAVQTSDLLLFRSRLDMSQYWADCYCCSYVDLKENDV